MDAPGPSPSPSLLDEQPDSDAESDLGVSPVDEFYGECIALISLSLLTCDTMTAGGDLNMAERRRLLSQATLAMRHTRGVQDALQKMPFVPIHDGCFDTRYIIDSNLEGETGVSSRVYDMCSRGCQAFTGKYKKWDATSKCGVCNLPRPRTVRPDER